MCDVDGCSFVTVVCALIVLPDVAPVVCVDSTVLETSGVTIWIKKEILAS